MAKLVFKRIILKLSGEILAGKQGFGIEVSKIKELMVQIKDAVDLKVELGIVIGGGNIYRGLEGSLNGITRANGDYIGMLATIINSLTIQNFLEALGIDTRTQTSITMRQVAEPYIRRKAIRHLEKGRVVIFGGGTGNPYFSTDTAAALRGAEINVDAILKATKVDGVYDSDPMLNPNAKKFSELTYLDVLNKQLKIMDNTAISLCMNNKIPIVIFDVNEKENLKNILTGAKKVGTIIH